MSTIVELIGGQLTEDWSAETFRALKSAVYSNYAVGYGGGEDDDVIRAVEGRGIRLF